MKRFKNILYIIDEKSNTHDSIAEKVAKTARINEAKVTTMVAGKSSFMDHLTLRFSGRRDEILAALIQQQQEQLDGFLSHERWTDISTERYVSNENGFIGIIRKVLRDKHDLVIKEENLSLGIDQLAMRLVRKCPSPVWVIKNKTTDFNRILGAVDVATELAETERLNTIVLELTHSLAQREKGQAHYLHVWQLAHESMLRSARFRTSDDEITKMKENLCSERLHLLQSQLANNHIEAEDNQVHLAEGGVVETINKLIEALEIDVLVMGSLGRSGIPGFLIGNRAEKLLGNINCTVLTVKPDGFISPVTIE